MGKIVIDPVTRIEGHLKVEVEVEDGKVAEKRIDDAVTRILGQKFRFGLFEKQAALDAGKIAGKDHAQFALDTARKSIVLLKNEKSALPLERKEIKTIALIGPFADSPNIGDRGSSVVRPPYVITPLAGIRDKAGQGVEVNFDSGENLDSVGKLASSADAAIVAVGCDWNR
jgi:beta-glucosidase